MLFLQWDYGIPGMVDAARSLADLQAKGLIKQVSFPEHLEHYSQSGMT